MRKLLIYSPIQVLQPLAMIWASFSPEIITWGTARSLGGRALEFQVKNNEHDFSCPPSSRPLTVYSGTHAWGDGDIETSKNSWVRIQFGIDTKILDRLVASVPC